MIWLENIIGKSERYFPSKCFRINFSNLNFIHKKANLCHLPQFFFYSEKYHLSPLFLSCWLANTFPSLLILADFYTTRAPCKHWLCTVCQALCQRWETKYFLPWSLPSWNSFPALQTMCYPIIYNLGYSTYFLSVFGSSHRLSIGICFRTYSSLPKILWPSHNFRAGILCQNYTTSTPWKSHFFPNCEVWASDSWSNPLHFLVIL